MEMETLEAVVGRIYRPADELLPQHAWELDLNTLSGEELQQLSCSFPGYVNCDEKSCRDKLSNLRALRGFRPNTNNRSVC
jgi:hypothetical protein